MTTGQTLTQRTRAQLESDASPEFTVSRTALSTLVSDSERYAQINGRLVSELVSYRRRQKKTFGYGYEEVESLIRLLERVSS